VYLVGNYLINIKIGDVLVPVPPQMIQELTITEDIDRLLPTFKLVLKDATKSLGDIIPFDKSSDLISIEISRTPGVDKLNEFKFLVDRREVFSGTDYSVQGILNIEGLLDPSRTRVLTGNIKTNLESIARDELNIENTEIDASLNYDKTLLQPDWTNAQLLRYWKRNLLGNDQQADYYCFVKNVIGEPIFVFKSINELVSSSVQYNFMIGHKQFEDFYPVSEYKIFDNSRLINQFGTKTQSYSYFDYSTGSYSNRSISIEKYPSLVEQHLIDDDSDISGVRIVEGRSNDFTSNFEGRERNSYYNRLTNLINMWISTWGLQNASPGDIVKVVFNEALDFGDLFLFQHSGYWMIKRVVHSLTTSFMTNFLLIRSGIDTSIETSLLRASHPKGSKS